MTAAQRRIVLAARKREGVPWHSPPRRLGSTAVQHLSAANYEHSPIVGNTPERLADFETSLLQASSSHGAKPIAWCVLPNHYHVLLNAPNLEATLAEIGRLHGRTSFAWNQEEGKRGRKCWHRCSQRYMRNEAHRWATLNYIHNNPVHHGYVAKWQEWPFSSAAQFLGDVGQKKAREIWDRYPVLDYGKGWDDPDI